jgi:tyrosine-protein kinase Etk/Wzc
MEFLRIWEILVRRKWIIAGVFFLFALTTYLGVKLIDTTYQAKAKLLIEGDDTMSTLMQSLGLTVKGSSTTSSSTDSFETDIALVMVRPVLQKVIDTLRLVDRTGTTLDPDDFANLKIAKKLKYKLKPQPYIEVEQYEDADLLELSAYSTSAAQAAGIANALAGIYIEDRLQRIREEYKAVRLYIQGQIRNVSKDYQQSLADQRDFKIREKTIDLALESQNAVNKVAALTTKYNELLLGISEKSADYTPDHPEIQKLQKEVDTVKQLIALYQQEVVPIAGKAASSSQLDLPLAVNKEIYQKLLEYMTQVEVAESMTISNIKLVEPAVVPTKAYFPVKMLSYLLGAFLGLFWGTALAFFIEYIDNTIKTPDDLKKHFRNETHLGSIPKSSVMSKAVLITELSPTHPIAEVFRTIRNSIRFASVDKPIKTLMVTSSMEGEGKTTCSANIGITFRDAAAKTIVVDLDFRKPTLHTKFKLAHNRGVINVIMETATLDDVIVSSGVDGIDVLPSGPVPEDPTKLVESRKIRDILAQLNARYDLVILDTPPILAVNDALVLGRLADATVMIMGAGMVSFSAFDHAKEQLDRAGINLLGIILNKFKTQGAKYYYYRQYGKYGLHS